MSLLLALRAVGVVAARRLLAQPWLALATAAGLIVAVALVMSIPLYADGVYNRILNERVAADAAATGDPVSRPPFAFLFRYNGAWSGSKQWDEVQLVDQYLSQTAGPSLGLPERLLVRYFRTDTFRLFPQDEAAYADIRQPLAWVSFGFVDGLQDHITVLEGAFPASGNAPGEPIEVLVSESFALKLGLQVGESYVAFEPPGRQTGGRPAQLPMRVAGIWQPRDPNEDFWFYRPDALSDVLLVAEESYVSQISPFLGDEVYLALWYLVMDGSGVTSGDAEALLGRIARVWQRAEGLLAATTLVVSPVEALQLYLRSARLLTILLVAFSVPVIGLVLAFIGLVVGLTVDRQRNEIATLRSRGATAGQILGIAALEGVLLGAAALLVGIPTAQALADLIGRAQSFLNFTAPPAIQISLTGGALRFGVAAAVLAFLAKLAPTLGASRQTIVTYKQESARVLRPPWWQRAWLDLLLLAPVVYGIYLLRRQESIVVLESATGGNDPFQNPLLFLLPALAIFALALFMLRLLPPLMAALAWLASQGNSVGLLLSARYLARSPRFYTAPLLLLVMTLSLAAFTASLAQTLDTNLYDQNYYRVGADIYLREQGESTGGPTGFQSRGNEPAEVAQEPRWLFLPVSEHLKAPGVLAAARVGRYGAAATVAGTTVGGATYLGVDRLDFPRVAFWRPDFALQSLGALMNALALKSNGVLVPREFLSRHALQVGDTVRVAVRLQGQPTELDLEIAGAFDLFPTWYPSEGPLFVGNLDYLFEQLGAEVPYDVWLRTDPEVDVEATVAGVRELGLTVLAWDAALPNATEQQLRPERQGLFGLLSIGFLAAAFLTVIGFLLYALFSFRRRFIELGVLRAVGLGTGQMTAVLGWEMLFLLGAGLIAGTVLGAWVSALFIPALQVGESAARVPPFLVEIAWPAIFRIYLLFGLLFVAALAVLIMSLRRMKVFEAIKLGETG